jgi:hypothetical protein
MCWVATKKKVTDDGQNLARENFCDVNRMEFSSRSFPSADRENENPFWPFVDGRHPKKMEHLIAYRLLMLSQSVATK